MSRTAPVLGAVALVALLLTGCTDPDPAPTDPGTTAEAAPSPTPSADESSPAPSPTPVVVAPERPAEMDDDGYEGAQAAATYFLSLDDYIMKTGDTAEWEAMSHKECGYCSRRLEQAQEIHEREYTWTGGEASIEITHIYEQDAPTGIWPVDVRVSADRASIHGPDGEVVFDEEPSTFGQRVEVVESGSGWQVVAVSGLEGE